ncbi:diguanylate cyclase [Piscinibacter sakaiensis]|uniref:sensor domain-containing diguanylate cyclase n=1 Tax=Piscinibacter sakaiensis TaxID=1547922 RepID=UPI003AAB8FF7
MKIANRFRIGPIARLSLGLVAILVTLVLLGDMLLGVVPSRGEVQRDIRHRIAENLVIQFSALLEAGDTATLAKTIQQVLSRDESIRSISVQRTDGLLVLHRGEALAPATGPPQSEAGADHLRIPVYAGREVWGNIDIRFRPQDGGGLSAWLMQPAVQMMLLLGIGGFLLCYAYLRRAMQYLNPSASVPDRVRKAFDSLAEGLVIVDQQARIVLANRIFRQFHPQGDVELNGQAIERIDWLAAARKRAAGADAAAPWTRTLATGEPVVAMPMELARPDGDNMQLLVSSAAITDNSGRARGCLITFDNVTAVHKANADLQAALDELKSSRYRIEEQNEELRRLASRDPLTGSFNRRALFEFAGDLFTLALTSRQPLCCLMVDIDHFKQFNDLYGHAVGDQVIQVVARLLTSALRETDVLGRYGGEEFCVVMPTTNAQQALSLAERMRREIEATARGCVQGVDVMPITASFGVASLSAAAQSIEGLIDQADQALYTAKQAGRNRVKLWTAPSPSHSRSAELSDR